MKVMVIVGTRPELIRLSTTLIRLKHHDQLVLVHTGQNYDYELNEIFFEDLNLPKPDYFLEAVGETLAETIGKIIYFSDMVIEKEQPDAILILGDTNSSLSVISAKRRKIPIFHYEAGNRCFDERVPEEINRKIVDHISDINLTYSEIAKQNLLNEGIKMDRVFNIGSPMFEVLNYYREKILRSAILNELGLNKSDYFVLSAHREETVDNEGTLRKLMIAMDKVSDVFGFEIVFSVHPRTRKKLELLEDGSIGRRIRFIKPLGFTDYVSLQQNAFCVLSDSGTITEESSILGFSAINIRETHERHEGMEKTAVVMSGLDSENILEAIRITVNSNRSAGLVDAYQQTGISERIQKIIVSYTGYINRNTWRRF